jgi:hypothetical protein
MASSLASQLPQGSRLEHDYVFNIGTYGSWLASNGVIEITPFRQ